MNKDKQSSFSEKLMLQLEALWHDDIGVNAWNTHKAIIDLVKSIVPDQKPVWDKDPDGDIGNNIGFNKCRQEILDKLDSPKEL